MGRTRHAHGPDGPCRDDAREDTVAGEGECDVKHRARRRLVPVVAVVVAVGGLLVPAAQAKAEPPKYYSVLPGSTQAAPGDEVTLTFTNTRRSQQPFGSMQLSVPADSGLDLSTVATDRGWTVGAPVTAGGTTAVTVQAVQGPVVAPGESVEVTFEVGASAPEDSVTVTTRVKQSNDFNGEGNDFALTTAQPVVHVTGPLATGMVFASGPSTVQDADSPASPGVAAVTAMCPPVVVHLVDDDGDVATGEPDRTVTLSAAGAGLRVGGSTTLTATAVDGVATFGGPQAADGTCTATSTSISATATGLGYPMSAAATLSSGAGSADADGTFDVLPVYGRCAGDCSSSLDDADGTTTAGVTATDTASTPEADLLTFSVELDDNAELLAACDPDPGTDATANPYRSPVTVDLAGHDKTVQLRWSKKAVQWATNNGASKWQVCLAATSPFAATLADGSVGEATLVGGWYVGALLPCGDPALAATDPCLARLGRNAGDQVADVVIPDRPGDPRMY